MRITSFWEVIIIRSMLIISIVDTILNKKEKEEMGWGGVFGGLVKAGSPKKTKSWKGTR